MTSDTPYQLLLYKLALKELEVLYILFLILFEIKNEFLKKVSFFWARFRLLFFFLFMQFCILSEFLSLNSICFLNCSIRLISFSLYSLSSLFFSLYFLNLDAPSLIAFSSLIAVSSAYSFNILQYSECKWYKKDYKMFQYADCRFSNHCYTKLASALNY